MLNNIQAVDDALAALPSVEELMQQRKEHNIEPDRDFCTWHLACERARFKLIRKYLEYKVALDAAQQPVKEQFFPQITSLNQEYQQLKNQTTRS